ncbi:lipid kinase [Alsobacter metallidurans]|uniref:Lipid kinase n=1 Tax=Alsobacter metallidurans TaxID=340221 RepID=A0A917I5T4_9HYPH|nr:lipid kinase [Alsobacter metallidurans]GGH13403.1 lipid kinase [Alsobacter metallidurans]
MQNYIEESHAVAGEPAGAEPGAARRALVLINPNSRRGAEAVDEVSRRLEAGGLALQVETFTSPEEVSSDIVRRAPEVDCVVVCGGDGSVNAAGPGLLETRLPFGIVPLGTGNDLARTLGIPEDLGAAIDIITAGKERTIDIGLVNGKPFFNVASLGISTDLAHTLTSDIKRRFGRLGYALAAMKVLTHARPFTATIMSKGEPMRVKTYQIAVGNGRYYGGGMAVAEHATIDDHHLDLYSLELSSVWKFALMLRAFRAGSHGAWEEVRTVRCTEFEIHTRKPRPVNCDGEICAHTPAKFQVVPKALRVFAP